MIPMREKKRSECAGTGLSCSGEKAAMGFGLTGSQFVWLRFAIEEEKPENESFQIVKHPNRSAGPQGLHQGENYMSKVH